MKIVATNRVFDETREQLEQFGEVIVNPSAEPWAREDLIARAKDATALLAFMTDTVDDDLLRQCPDLRIVAGALKGYDNFDVAACTRRGVWLTVVPDLLTVPTAELAVALVLGLNRHLLAGDAHVRGGAFRGWRPALYGFGLDGATVGIAGLGEVGRETARRLQGFGCRLLGCDMDSARAQKAREAGVEPVSFDDLLALSDVFILALPLTAATRGLISSQALARMRPGARLVNVGRGSVVCEQDVATALRDGRLAGYAADVFEFEDWSLPGRPQRIAPELLEMSDRTLFTPHLGSAVANVRRAIEMAAVDNIAAVLAGRRPPGAVNQPLGLRC